VVGSSPSKNTVNIKGPLRASFVALEHLNGMAHIVFALEALEGFNML
jgi:hypothetical protein